MLRRKVQKTNKDSYILTLPKALVLAIGLKKGTDLEISLKDRKIILTPAHETRQSSKCAEVPIPTIGGVDDE